MKITSKKSINRWQSFVHAFNGLRVVFNEPNAKIHAVIAFLAIALGLVFSITREEWVEIFFSIALVIGSEALNTALEKVVDIASPEWNDTARQAKDAAAASVLIFSLCAATVGIIIFFPRVQMMFSGI
jgi:diacylglycerol kinase